MRLPFALLFALFAMSSSTHLSAQNEPSVIRLDSINPYTYRSHLEATQSSVHHWNPKRNDDNEIEVWEPGQRYSSKDQIVGSGTSDQNLTAAAVSAISRLSWFISTTVEGTRQTTSLELSSDRKLKQRSLLLSSCSRRALSDSLKKYNIASLLGATKDWPQFTKPDAMVQEAFVQWSLLEEPDGKLHLINLVLVIEGCDRDMSQSIANLPPLVREGLHAVHVDEGSCLLVLEPQESNPNAVQLISDFLDAGYLLELYSASTQTASSTDRLYMANAIQPGAELPAVFNDPDQLETEYSIEQFKATFMEEMRKLESKE